VEEFFTNGAGLGYHEAKPGESFVKIGVGALRKPNEPRYSSFNSYEIVDTGKWSVKKGTDWIEFTHQLADTTGYAYTPQDVDCQRQGRVGPEHSLRTLAKPIQPRLQPQFHAR
jgi:hypothetical protein